MSVAASRLVHVAMPVFLGLTPQAMDMSPLRGSGRPTHFAAASRGHPTRMGAIRKRVPPLGGSGRSPHADGGGHKMTPLRGFAASSQKEGVDVAARVAASRLVHIVMPVFLGLTPQAMNVSPLRGWVEPPRGITGVS